MQISIVASFEKQAKDKKEQATHSECDPLDNNEGFDLDNSTSATNLDTRQLFIMACLQGNVSVGMKRVKAKVFIQDPFNPVLFTEDAERDVDVSNIVCALTC